MEESIVLASIIMIVVFFVIFVSMMLLPSTTTMIVSFLCISIGVISSIVMLSIGIYNYTSMSFISIMVGLIIMALAGVQRSNLDLRGAISWGAGIMSGKKGDDVTRLNQITEPSAKVALKLVKKYGKWVADPLVSVENKKDDTRLRKVVAAFFGATALHSAIGVYPYLFSSDHVRSITLERAILGSIFSVFWIAFTCVIFYFNKRKSDYSSVFRSAFLFNGLLYTLGKIAHALSITG